MPTSQTVTVGDRVLKLTNLEKVLYPAAGFTKAQVIDFYIRVSPWLLPHLKDRPITMKRYPDGVDKPHFYEKDAPRFTPEWVQTFHVPRREGGKPIRYILINDLPALVWAANLANIELHPFLHRAPQIHRPTEVVFDLDPGEGAGTAECAEVALLLKRIFDELKLKAFPKMSGSKGIQLYVPLNTSVTYEQTQAFAHTIAGAMARAHPKMIVAEMARNLREGKVFIDWSQNSDFKTTAGVYSLRAKRADPFVSMPVTWEELAKSKDLQWRPHDALERLEKTGDLFAPVLKLKQQLPGTGPERRRKTQA